MALSVASEPPALPAWSGPPLALAVAPLAASADAARVTDAARSCLTRALNAADFAMRTTRSSYPFMLCTTKRLPAAPEALAMLWQ